MAGLGNGTTKSDLLLRLARPAEATAIADLSRELVEYGLRWRWTRMRVLQSIRAANVNVLIACDGETMAGFAIMRYADDDAHLDLLGVAPAYRRQGVGRSLLQWLEECAKVAGIFKIDLEMRSANKGAQIFYESLGYKSEMLLPGYYDGVEAALRMSRDLAPHRASA
ncbi:MAG TPA: GNAT family N-acetyltransferase [Candidatus Binatia bacterium]|jgi:ribosomal-protein-alanine N-acetyltransferase